MALVTVQRSPSPSASADTEEQDVLDEGDSNLKSPRQRRRKSKSALKKLRKLFNTVRFVTRLKPCFSESYFTVKGAALILPQSDEIAPYTRRVTKSHAGDDIQSHLQAMFSLLRPQDTIKVAVKLEGTHTRYLIVVSCVGRQDTEESVILGIDIMEKASVGIILPVWAHMHIQLDGDGGFIVQSDSNIYIFKPVSVQAMWSALQSLNKVVKIAKDKLYIPRGLTHTWVGYYEAKLTAEAVLVSEWNATADIDKSYRTDKSLGLGDNCGRTVRRTMSTPVSGSTSNEWIREEDMYMRIRLELKNVMMTVDLEEVTCLFVRRAVEEKMGMDLKKYKSYIDTEMMEILGQMDSPTQILEYLYLGSEWNASNLEELQENGVHHILNISREIDNFFPGILHYMNIREWDRDASDLLKYWEDTHRFINKARRRGSKALVHCKMGISRSASTVIAYLMKEKKWRLQQAFEFTKLKRSIINPNPGFWKQLETYEGILTANWNRQLFNRPDLSKPVNLIEEGSELPEGINPEDFLSVKLGQEAESSSYPFMDVEQDSRSADSMEDSLPDQLSPDSVDRLDKKKFKYSKSDNDKDDSDDDSSSGTDSDLTDSDELSSEYETEEAEREKGNKGEMDSKVFVPISIPDVQLDIVEERKEPMNVDRRCKSESDKDLLALTLDENLTSFSREGSASIFKPDCSWIKPASESEMENNDTIVDEHEVDGDAKGDEGGGLWMGIKPADEIKEEKMEVGLVEDTKTEDCVGATIAAQDENVDKYSEVTETIDTNSAEPYVRENIPWNPGTVKKQKQDIEDKYGCSNVKQRESLDSNEGESQEVTISQSTEETEKDTETKTAELDIDGEKHSIDSINQSQEIGNQIDQSVTVEVDRGSESPKMSPELKKSVYEEEEIDLPEGIVRKTLMEIEERNRIILDIPGRSLKRSSSLKSTRVTPKAKDRDCERRKTCIALLSPTHPDYTEREMFSTCSDAESPETGIDLGLGEAVCNTASEDSEDEVNSQTGLIKVYKFMGEELSVQEGLVRKQTMDIESKYQEPLIKQQIKSDVSSNSQEHYSDTANSSTDSKQATPLLESTSLSVEKSSTDKDSAKRSDSTSNLSSDIQREKLDTTDVTQTTENISVRERAGSFRMCTPVKKQTRPESRFDPETLELIREIGSALLNSPAKAELEENEDEDLKDGESLVNHYVKKIERISGVRKRKRGKEIIIIDKSASLEQHNVVSTSDSTSMTQNVSTCENKSVTSKWSPVSRKQTFSPPHTSKEKEEQVSTQSKSSNPIWSLVSKKEISPQAVEKQSPDFTTVDKNNKTSVAVHDSDASKSDLTLNLKSSLAIETDRNKEMEDEEVSEKCSVKKLLGKFEQPELASGKVTPMFGTSPSMLCSNTLEVGAKLDSSESNSRTISSPDSSLTSRSDTKGQGHSFSKSKSPLLHRQSEPVIHLSERSMLMFQAKLNEMGTSLCDKSLVKEETDEFQSGNSRGPCVRPKSASYGPAAGRKVNLRQSQTLSESETEQFTWEGKKVRKLYGKTHPLAKLERKQYMESARNSPFYNTM